MMVEAGVVMPNRQWDPWTEEEINAAIDICPKVIQVLVYRTPAAAKHAQQCHELAARIPGLRFLYRMYGSAIPTVRPETWASIVVYCLINNNFPPGSVIPANEMNLPGEGGHSDWFRHAAWLTDFANAYRGLMGASGRQAEDRYRTLHLPAWSPTSGYKYGWRALSIRSVHLLYDVIDVHQYGGDTQDVEFMREQFSDKPVSVTEFNNVRPSWYLKELRRWPWVKDACWFILSGTEDQREYWLMGSQYYEDFKGYTHEGGGTDMSEHKIEATLNLTPQEAAAFSVWYPAAGYAGKIVYDQLRLYAVATQDSIPATLTDLERALDKIGSGVAEAKLILAKLPNA